MVVFAVDISRRMVELRGRSLQCGRSSPSARILLPLDDCLYALQATIPHLTRSSLHRCLKRHAISRLPEIAGDKAAKNPPSAKVSTKPAYSSLCLP
jgi:hypothetical protein